MQKSYLFTAMLGCVVMIGCGGDGLQRVAIDGELRSPSGPVPHATVQLIPQGTTVGEGAIGLADQAGKFTVVSSRNRDAGIPAGAYRVRISQLINGDGTVLPGDATQAEYPDSREGVPPPYSTMESPLEITIPDSGGSIVIELPVDTLGK